MATRPADARSGAPPGLEAATLCEAFQRSASEMGDEVALRTLGDATSIRRVEIRWPSGAVQELRDARPGKYVRVEEPATAPQ